jgi:uncharacterized protein (DUF2267 family)
MGATTNIFVEHVAAHAGLPFDRAERAVRAVLGGIGAYLTEAHRQLVAEELPPALGASLVGEHDVAMPIEERLLGPGMTAGRAREVIASACRVLVEELSNDALRALREDLPITMSALLAAPSPAIDREPAQPQRHATLASGRPGSTHPISEARPARRQTDSVAGNNPHASTKLSSASGTTQERHHETLAEGRPGYDRALAGSRRGGSTG